MNANENRTFCTTETTTVYQGSNDHGFDDNKGRAYGHRYRIWVLRTGDEVTEDEARDTYSRVHTFKPYGKPEEVTYYTSYTEVQGYQIGTPNQTEYRVEVKATRGGEDFGASHRWETFDSLDDAFAYVDKRMAAGYKAAERHKKRNMDVQHPRTAVSDEPFDVTWIDDFERREVGQRFLVEQAPEVPSGANVKDYRV